MFGAIGWRMAAGVLALTGGGLAMALGFLVITVALAMSAFHANTGDAVLAGVLAVLFGFGALAGTALLFVPRPAAGLAVLAAAIAGLLWAFAQVDAVGLALVPVVPLACAVVCALAGTTSPPDPLSIVDGEGE